MNNYKQKCEEYSKNPNICLSCGSKIELNNKKLSEVIIKKYCNKSCAVSANNLIPKRKKLSQYNNCTCGNLKKMTAISCKECVVDKNSIQNRTIGQLRLQHKTYSNTRIAIARNARRVFKKLNIKSCIICGYDKHVEAAHIRSVASFDDTTLLREINNKENLVALCPNCHWEYDNGLLELNI